MRGPAWVLVPLHHALFGTEREDVQPAAPFRVRHRQLISVRNLRHRMRAPSDLLAERRPASGALSHTSPRCPTRRHQTCLRRQALQESPPRTQPAPPRGNRVFYTCQGRFEALSGPEVLVSFGIGPLSKHPSFPRKRESSPPPAHFQWLAE